MVQWLPNPTRNHEVVGSIPGLAQCLWARRWAPAPISPLAGEPPYAAGSGPKKGKKKKKKKKKSLLSQVPENLLSAGL